VDIAGVSTSEDELIPLDIDVSPSDNSKTKKEGVSRTYKGTDGFAPIFATPMRIAFEVTEHTIKEGQVLL